MKKVISFVVALFFISSLSAEGLVSTRKSNPNYKYLKVYAKVLQRYGNSSYYQIQIDIVNTGDKSLSFWQDMTTPYWSFSLTAGEVWFIYKKERQCYEKGIKYKPAQLGGLRKIRILPHAKYTTFQEFFIESKETFLKTNKDLRLVFYFNDANFGFMADYDHPKVMSENSIEFNW